MKLKDKVALITGASSGIGKAIAQRFADEGAHVVVNYLAGKQADEDAARAEAASYSEKSIAIAADVSKRDQVQAMIDETVKQLGRIDIAVNNAGIEFKKPFLDVSDQEWNTVLAVNLYGAFVVSQCAARQMVEQGDGGKLIYVFVGTRRHSLSAIYAILRVEGRNADDDAKHCDGACAA